MFDYLRAECYKVVRRKYLPGFLIVMFLCEGLLVGGWIFTNAHGNNMGFAGGAGVMVSMLSIGFYCTILTADMVFSDQYKFNTLKNEVSFGLPRARIFAGKLIIECLLALVLCALVLAFYLGLCWITLPHDPELDGATMSAVISVLKIALPLWLGAQAFVNLLFFLIHSSTVCSFIAVGIFMGAGGICRLLGALVSPVFRTLYQGLLTSPLEQAVDSGGSEALFLQACVVGLCWFVFSTALGLVLFQRKEIS